MLFSMWVSVFHVVGCSVDWFIKKMRHAFLENLSSRSYLDKLGN